MKPRRILYLAIGFVILFSSCRQRQLQHHDHESENTVQTGQPTLPDIDLPDLEDTSQNIYSVISQNSFTIIDFWASWCQPCRREIPVIKQIYDEYKEKGIGIVGISLDKSHDDWKNCIDENGMAWLQLSDLKGWDSKACEVYGVNGIPYTIVTDRTGTVLAEGLRGEGLRDFIANLLDSTDNSGK